LRPAQGDALLAAWRLQSALAQLIALGNTVPFDPALAREPFRRKLATVAELPDFRALEGALKGTQAAAHEAMRTVLAGF
jgi:hypothetical protein